MKRNNSKFCLDVSSLSHAEKKEFANNLKKSVDSFNNQLKGDKDE